MSAAVAGADAERAAARYRAALPGSGFDRRMRALKRFVPIAAGAVLLGALATTFVARDELSFLLSRDSVATASERLRVSAATYRGTDKQGRPFSVSAANAVQRSAATPVVELSDLTAELQLADGPARVRAAAGRFDLERDTLQVDGPVRVTQGGYRLASGRLDVDIERQRVTSLSPVTGATPLGTFAAERMEADVMGERVVLAGGARLRIARARAR